MSSKKNEFDFVDFMQKHNRNVALERNAKAAEQVAQAKKEQARQAKLDREANDLHRLQMKEMAKAEKEANERHRAKIEEIVRKEQEAKAFSKQQQFKLYDLSCQIEELEKQETVIARIKLFYEINAEFEKIEHDAIEDLQYRKLYTQVRKSLNKELTIISEDYSKEQALFLKYDELKKEADRYENNHPIQTFGELHHAEVLLNKAQVLSEELSGLSLESILRTIKKSIETFYVSAANLKWFWNNFATNDLTESNPELHHLLITFYKLDEKIMQHEEWEHIDSIGPSSDVFIAFCDFCCDFIRKNNNCFETVLQIMERIDSPEAEKTIERIKGDLKKRLIKVLSRKKNEKEKTQKKESANTGCGCGCLIFIVFAFAVYLVVGIVVKYSFIV